VTESGAVKGRFTSSGIRPKFAEKFAALGIELPRPLFDPPGNVRGLK
jgi:pilus assembly protein CpaF